MIRRASECRVETRTAMREGPGTVQITTIATKEEMLNNARLHGIIELKPGCGIGYHEHTGETEIFYIIEGEALYNDNGTEVTLGAGDVAVCPPGEGHGITNISEGLTRFTATIVLE